MAAATASGGNTSFSNSPLIENYDSNQIVVPEVSLSFFFGPSLFHFSTLISPHFTLIHLLCLSLSSVTPIINRCSVSLLMSTMNFDKDLSDFKRTRVFLRINQWLMFLTCGFNVCVCVIYMQKKSWKNFFSYLGPGFLVSIAYIDPGNCKD